MAFLLNLLSQGLNYRADKAQWKAQTAMKEYRNKMVNIANAINQNAITQNTTLTIQQSARQAVHMRKDELTTLGSTTVAAAAAGVRGKSVNAALVDVKRKAGLLEKQRTDDLEQYFLQARQQRLSSSLSAVQNQDLSYLPKPRFSTYLLRAGIQTAQQAAQAYGAG